MLTTYIYNNTHKHSLHFCTSLKYKTHTRAQKNNKHEHARIKGACTLTNHADNQHPNLALKVSSLPPPSRHSPSPLVFTRPRQPPRRPPPDTATTHPCPLVFSVRSTAATILENEREYSRINFIQDDLRPECGRLNWCR